MRNEENISKYIDEQLALANKHLSNLQNLSLQEDICQLAAKSNKAIKALPVKPPYLRRTMAFLIAKMANYLYLYHLYQRRIKEIIHIGVLSHFSDEVIYRITLAIRRLFDRLCWYLRLNPEQEIRRGSYTLETRISVHQAWRRITVYKYIAIVYPLASLFHILIAHAIFDSLVTHTQYRVSSLEIALFYLGSYFFLHSSLSLVLSILSVGMFTFDLIFILAQFRPPNHGGQI